MKNICNIEECTGCMACVNVCAHQAIYVKADDEGFDRPVIDEALCVDCALCIKTCPINHHPLANEAKEVYSGWSSDDTVRTNSSSGGAFTEIARPILEEGGVVFGCSLNENLQAEHIYVETLEDLANKLRGSKYVQSKIGNSYAIAKDFLRQGRKVLFSGTPCQIAGLKNYLRKDYDNLLTVDLICHGVPSPLIFEEYKKYITHAEKMDLTDVKFRCKKSSWIFYNMTLKGHVEKSSALKTYIGSYYGDPYIRGFLRDYFLRPSCHKCHFTSTKRCSDFTIADWWGYKKENPDDKNFQIKGVSLILVNTENALAALPQLNLTIRKRTIEEALKTNISLQKAFPMPDIRKTFWEDYSKLSFPKLVDKYMKPEKIGWTLRVMQHYPNTEFLMFFIQVVILPKRIIGKILRQLKLR